MTDRSKPRAISGVLKGALGHMAAQAWYCGHLDAAAALIETVLGEAVENSTRFPKDEVCKEAVLRLTRARDDIEHVSAQLGKIAVGGKPNG